MKLKFLTNNNERLLTPIELITRHILDQTTSIQLPPQLPFLNLRLDPIKKRVGRLASMTWF